MVMVKRHLVLFGGFHDSFSGDHTKYFSDVGVFDTDTREWKKIEVKLKSQVAKANAGRVQIRSNFGRFFFDFRTLTQMDFFT